VSATSSGNGFANQAAIVGIGATEFSKASGRSELQLAAECVIDALTDAGIDPAEVDGISTFKSDNNPESEVHRIIGGRNLKFFSRVDYGGGAACAVVMQAAMAIATGVCEVVVVYRAFNERSQYRYGTGESHKTASHNYDGATRAWGGVHGLVSPASNVAMSATRYMYEYGASSEDFGRYCVLARKYAANNPKAWFYQKPITLEDHQTSRWIVEPLRLLDCCQESDGGVALVITSAERARKLRQTPALIRAASQGSCDDQHMMTSYYRENIAHLPEMKLVADQLWEMSGLQPGDMQYATIYDHFSPYVFQQLEALGYCGLGQARDFIREGQLELDGSLPTNTHGGQLGEAYIHGVNGIAEAVRQIRGSSCNQVKKVENAVVTAGTGVPTSGLILGQI
tara:strand:+ start:4029 stop:5219 length:1191 start_codon:yes stop_codon:yes gene_type:complete